MKSLKISYILPDFDENAYSGGLYVIFEHCNRLKERGHIIRVFNNTGKKSKYLRLDCEIERHKDNPEIIENNSPHIVVGTHWRTYFFISKMRNILRNNTKLCLMVQSNDRLIVKDEEKALAAKSIVGKYKNTFPIYKIAVSKYIQHMLKEYGQDSINIENGFEPKEITPLLNKAEKVKIIARYDPSQYRGWDLTNKVLKKISKERNNIEIHLFEMKNKKPTEYKSFFHKGLVGEKLLGLFKSGDIYVTSSIYEGFSYPTIEAMSQGCCVCCTDAGGNLDFCIDSDTALVSQRGDEKGLYNNLIRLVDDRNLRNRLKSNGINKINEFKWENSIDKLEDFFNSICGEKYDNSLVEIHNRENHSAENRRNVTFVYNKDPFSRYNDWLKVEGTIEYFKNLKFSTHTLLFIDKHNAKSVRARLRMLIQREDLKNIKWKIFYNRKIRIKYPIFNKTVFLIYSLFKVFLDRISASPYKYNGIFSAEEKKPILEKMCKLIKIPFYVLNFEDNRNKDYRFEEYTAEFLQKEEEYRKLMRNKLGETINKFITV